MSTHIQQLVGELAVCLQARDQRLAVAESCTGGWVAKVCTDAPGSSAWFDSGFVAYSNAAKQRLLGVPAVLLEEQGAVSEATVQAMAAGALAHSDAHWSLAISGIAGPGGGSAAKPVGTVWFAWAGPRDWRASRRCHFAGDREAVRRQAVETALQGLVVPCRGQA